MNLSYFLFPAATDPPPAQRKDETTIANLTDQWIFTRSVTMLIKDSRTSHRHGHEGRRRDSIPTVEAHALLR
jgi:hypothetical protein